MARQALIAAYEAAVDDLDAILEWCYPFPGERGIKEANLTFLFSSHALRILNNGAGAIKDCSHDAFAYMEAPIIKNPSDTKEQESVDAIIADWKSCTFVAIESKRRYTEAERKGIDSQVGRLLHPQSRRRLLHRFDWPRRCNPTNVWLVVMAGYWGRIEDGEVPSLWTQQFENLGVPGESRYKALTKRKDMKIPFGVLFHCAQIGTEAMEPSPEEFGAS